MSQKIVLWSVAIEPLFLAAVAWFLRRSGAMVRADPLADGEILLAVFSAAGLAMLWTSFQFASGRFAPKAPGAAPSHSPLPLGQMVVAVALATGPGVLGFVHYLVYGVEWVLPVFNLGAFILAARHVINFSAERR
jgi:hypothetical protein